MTCYPFKYHYSVYSVTEVVHVSILSWFSFLKDILPYRDKYSCVCYLFLEKTNFKNFSTCPAVLKFNRIPIRVFVLKREGGGGYYTKQPISHLTAMFQSRVYMIEKSAVKHIFLAFIFFLHKWKKTSSSPRKETPNMKC